MINTYTLTRDYVNETGTFGTLVVDGKTYKTVERPWVNNAPEISCIPTGFYLVKQRTSSVNVPAGLVVAYELQNVPDRTNIEIHVANYPTDVKGCIGLGRARAYVGGRWLVSLSRDAVRDFYAQLASRDFWLTIKTDLP